MGERMYGPLVSMMFFATQPIQQCPSSDTWKKERESPCSFLRCPFEYVSEKKRGVGSEMQVSPSRSTRKGFTVFPDGLIR